MDPYETFRNMFYQQFPQADEIALDAAWAGYSNQLSSTGNAGNPSTSLMQNWLGDNLTGVQDFSGKELARQGINEPGVPTSGGGGNTMAQPLDQEDYAVLHAKAYIPIPFRMRHHRVGSGRHDALLGTRTVFSFAYKRSCAAFCDTWNAMFSHVGSALQFIPSDVIQAFSDMLIGGSGAFGIENGFTPPFKGRVDL